MKYVKANVKNELYELGLITKMADRYIKIYNSSFFFLIVVIQFQWQQEFYFSEYFIKVSDTLNYRILMPKDFDAAFVKSRLLP